MMKPQANNVVKMPAMSHVLYAFWIATRIFLPLSYLACCKAQDLYEKEAVFQFVKNGNCLSSDNGVISSHSKRSQMECELHCLWEITCVSFNYRLTNIRLDTEVNCQLLNKTGACHIDRERENNVWTSYEILMPCLMMNYCKNGGKCVVDDVDLPRRYHCVCNYIYSGELCENKDATFDSCESVLQKNSSAEDGVYELKTDTAEGYTDIYCQMKPLSGCPGGGWTMAMKIDGGKNTFEHSSSYWSNKISHNLPGGMTSFDDEETKLPTYWSTSFKELCVGMKVGSDLNFVHINFTAESLYAAIADGNYRPTTIGREKWKSLISGSSLQRNCNKEGFNSVGENPLWAKARLGIIGNNEDDCILADSLLGFGVELIRECHDQPEYNACGNEASCSADNGKVNIVAMGYVMIR